MISTTDLFAGRYQLGALLGQGGMSDVYRAVDRETGEPVAVKVVRSGDPELARRLAQEVKVHERMEHPGLIRLISTGLAEGQAYLVMELIEGTTLAASLRDPAALGARLTAKSWAGSWPRRCHTCTPKASCTGTSNPRTSCWRPMAGPCWATSASPASLMGPPSPSTAPPSAQRPTWRPEQLEDHQVGPPADIWSLGLVLLESLTGRRTYDGSWSEIIARRLAAPVPLPADLPVPWKLLLTGMLDHRPAQRLDGSQVASLLASSAFAQPWAPSPVDPLAPAPATATVPLDLTALVPRQPQPQPQPQPSSDTTGVVLPATPTAVATSDTAVRGPTAAPPSRKSGRGWLLGLGVLVLVGALAGGLAYGLGSSSPGPKAAASQHRHGATTTVPPTTTTTVPPTTTTTAPPPTPSSALAALVSDVTSAMSSGGLNPSIGRTIASNAEQAVVDESAGHPNQAANDLAGVASLIAAGEQEGTITPAQQATFQERSLDPGRCAGTRCCERPTHDDGPDDTPGDAGDDTVSAGAGGPHRLQQGRNG